MSKAPETSKSDAGPSVQPRPRRANIGARPVFLEKASYRRRRIVDAVRLLPVIGGLLWAVPLLWTDGDLRISAALLYVFGIWVLLVIAASIFARGVADLPLDGDPDGTGTEPH